MYREKVSRGWKWTHKLGWESGKTNWLKQVEKKDHSVLYKSHPTDVLNGLTDVHTISIFFQPKTSKIVLIKYNLTSIPQNSMNCNIF